MCEGFFKTPLFDHQNKILKALLFICPNSCPTSFSRAFSTATKLRNADFFHREKLGFSGFWVNGLELGFRDLGFRVMTRKGKTRPQTFPKTLVGAPEKP